MSGKQIVKKKRRRVRYDLLIVGFILIVAGLLVYNIYNAATSATQTGGGDATRSKNLLNTLMMFADVKSRKNESVILIYRVRGDIPAGSYTLGTLDYIYVYINKMSLLVNESEKTIYTAFPYATQGPLNLVAELMGIGRNSENLADVFFNPTIVSTWSNLTIEEGSVSLFTLELLGEIGVLAQTYKYQKSIEGRAVYVEVTAFRAVNIGLIPVMVNISVEGSHFSLRLVDVRGV